MGWDGSQEAHRQAGIHTKKLIEAAVGAVDGDTPAPPELHLGWECQKWHCLPDAGGYLEQDYGLMVRISALSNIYAAYSAYRNAQGTQIHQLTEGARRILRQLKDMGVIFNG